MALLIGLMSGTSADGMDAALVDIADSGQCQLIDALCLPYSDATQSNLRQKALQPELPALEIMQLEREIAQYSVTAVQQLLERNQLTAQAIQAIGSHGHTLRHHPAPETYSWQIGDPNWIVEHTGITCVADFRRRDIAAGGQGAPLVPAFHAACLPSNSMVLNIGGIANLTVLAANEHTIGFDTGPGNALLDEWCQQHFACAHDTNGDLARRGKVITELLTQWLDHDYFRQSPPKSTGRELFQLTQLIHQASDINNYDKLDVLTTLTEFTAQSIALAVKNFGLATGELLVCGGGVHNAFLLERIQTALPQHDVGTTDRYGIAPDWLEAMAFAWLAWCTLTHQSGNLPAATGAQGARILGGIYSA